MEVCDYCQHVEMCGWRKDVNEQGCEFYDDGDKWIPVSERLPVKEGYYLTTTMYHEVFCDYWNSESFERTETVIAWMSLPEAYSEVSE